MQEPDSPAAARGPLVELNGYEACRAIRRELWGEGMMLLALTRWGQEEDRRRSQEAGFDCHLVKPVEPAVLHELLSDPIRRV